MIDIRQLRDPRPVETRAYFSQALGREQPYSYIAPSGWDGCLTVEARRYPLFVMLHGYKGRYTDWTTSTRLARYAAAYEIVFVFPDGGNGWYTNAADGSARYEDDLIQDFLPHVQTTLPLLPPGKGWGIGGPSMGGYGAVKLALKHPDLFSIAVSHSGAFERTQTKKPHPVFGDPESDASLRRAENPFSLVEQAMSRWPTERPYLALDCGDRDDLLEGNRRFQNHLRFIGYPHVYREMPGQHTWPYWDRAFRTVFPEVAAKLLAGREGA